MRGKRAEEGEEGALVSGRLTAQSQRLAATAGQGRLPWRKGEGILRGRLSLVGGSPHRACIPHV